MSVDIGYLQTKIREFQEKNEKLENKLSSIEQSINNSSKAIEKKLINLENIRNKIEDLNPSKIKEEIISNTQNIINKSHNKNLQKNKKVLKGWWDEVSQEIIKRGDENDNNLNTKLKTISDVLIKILKLNNIKVEKEHLEVLKILLYSQEELEVYKKSLDKKYNRPINDKGWANLKKGLPNMDIEKFREEFREEELIRIEKINQLDVFVEEKE
tara:strand:- start:5523 stop:6161 length:639 start_codon:yes stop_codon:yes gene_type:complete